MQKKNISVVSVNVTSFSFDVEFYVILSVLSCFICSHVHMFI